MQEIFYEETANIDNYKSAKIKYNLLKFISLLSYFCSILFAVLIFFLFDWSVGILAFNVLFVVVIFALFIVFGVVIGFVKNNYCVEYDYTFVSGSVYVDKVIKRAKRNSVVNFDCGEILKIGYFGSDEYNKMKSDESISVKVLTSNDSPLDNKDLYYILVGKGGNRTLYIFECTKNFIVNVIKFTNKNYIEKGLI